MEDLNIRGYTRVDTSNDFSFLVTDNDELFIPSMLFYSPIKKLNPIGSTFIEVLNNRNLIYDFFEDILSQAKNFETLEQYSQILLNKRKHYMDECNIIFECLIDSIEQRYNEYNRRNKDTKTLLKNAKEDLKHHQKILEDEILINNIYDGNLEKGKKTILFNISKTKEDIEKYSMDSEIWKVNEFKEIIIRYYKEIKKVIETIIKFIDSNNEKEKNELRFSLLWGLSNPQFTICVLDKNEVESYFVSHCNYGWYKINNLTNRLLLTKEYKTSEFLKMIDLNIDFLFQNKFAINKCQNCEKFFIPKSRSDEKYCDNEFINGITCKLYAPKHKFNCKEITQKYNMLVNRYRSKIRNSEGKKKRDFEEELEKFKQNFGNQKKINPKNEKGEIKIINWIDNQILEYERKYLRKNKSKNKIK